MGEIGTRPKAIRARVARFPFLDLPRNKGHKYQLIPSSPSRYYSLRGDLAKYAELNLV